MKLGAEDRLQLAVLDYIEVVLPHALIFHVPNGGRRSLTEGRKFKMLGVRAGTPDLVLVQDGRTYFFELKSPTGRLSPEQHRFGEDARIAGAGWAVIRSVDDVRNALKAWGIQTREAAHAQPV